MPLAALDNRIECPTLTVKFDKTEILWDKWKVPLALHGQPQQHSEGTDPTENVKKVSILSKTIIR